MPRYDFRCQKCESSFEVRMSMSDYSNGPLVECSNCGSEEVERTWGSVSVLTGSRSGGGASAPAPAPGCGHGGFT